MRQLYESVPGHAVCFWLLARTEQTARQTIGAEEGECSCVIEYLMGVERSQSQKSVQNIDTAVLSALFNWLALLRWRVRHQAFIVARSVCVSVSVITILPKLCWSQVVVIVRYSPLLPSPPPPPGHNSAIILYNPLTCCGLGWRHVLGHNRTLWTFDTMFYYCAVGLYFLSIWQ